MIPPVEFVALLALRYLLRVWDQSKCCCPLPLPAKTRKKTILSYKKLYEGPEFDIEMQYAQIWIISLMAFLFGAMLPILFLYAFLGMLILYVTLRIRIAYSVRRFPNYNQKMSKCMLYVLRYCPLIYTIVAAWLYSN